MKHLLICFILVGCTSTTGVMQLGKDTYTLSSEAHGTGSISGNDIKAKQSALSEANAYCLKLGKVINVKNTNMSSTGFGSTSELIFQCLDNDDPSYARPEYRREPAIKIENGAK